MQVIRWLAIPLVVGACSTPPVTDSFCELYQTWDFADRGFLGLNKGNKAAVLTNEDTNNRKCKGAGGLLPHP